MNAKEPHRRVVADQHIISVNRRVSVDGLDEFIDEVMRLFRRQPTPPEILVERVGYLLADLTETRRLSVHLPQDRAGSLRALLHVFEAQGISLSSIHSSRTPSGEVHFRIGFDDGADLDALRRAAEAIDSSGVGRVLERP